MTMMNFGLYGSFPTVNESHAEQLKCGLNHTAELMASFPPTVPLVFFLVLAILS